MKYISYFHMRVRRVEGLTETIKALLLLSLWTFHPMESKFFLNMFSKPPIDTATSKDNGRC